VRPGAAARRITCSECLTFLLLSHPIYQGNVVSAPSAKITIPVPPVSLRCLAASWPEQLPEVSYPTMWGGDNMLWVTFEFLFLSGLFKFFFWDNRGFRPKHKTLEQVMAELGPEKSLDLPKQPKKTETIFGPSGYTMLLIAVLAFLSWYILQ
jgi:hypothetical protein